MLDPFLTVHPLAQQLGAAHTAGNAVVPARNEGVDQVHTGDRHDCCSPPRITQAATTKRMASKPRPSPHDPSYHDEANGAKATSPVLGDSFSRCSIHSLRSIPSPSSLARRTQRVMQWYQRETRGSTRCTRAIVMTAVLHRELLKLP